jgi:hypothetical protein
MISSSPNENSSSSDTGRLSAMAPRGKAKAVARDGKVSLCVLDEHWPFAYLQVYADATVERDREFVVDVMMAVAGRMSGQPLDEEICTATIKKSRSRTGYRPPCRGTRDHQTTRLVIDATQSTSVLVNIGGSWPCIE